MRKGHSRPGHSLKRDAGVGGPGARPRNRALLRGAHVRPTGALWQPHSGVEHLKIGEQQSGNLLMHVY